MLIGLVLTLSIFAMGVLGNEGLGWFASNDRVTADDMGISVNATFDIVKSVEYFKIDSISLEDASNIYTFKKALTNKDEIILDTFSTLVAERQILIKITLQDGVSAVKVTAESSATEYIADETHDIKKENNSLSSVVELYSIPGSAVDTSGGAYVISSESFQSDARFASVDISGINAITSFTQYISVYETENGKDDDVIYIIVDYYEDAAEHVMETAGTLELNGELVFGDTEDKILRFTPDFTISVAKVA